MRKDFSAYLLTIVFFFVFIISNENICAQDTGTLRGLVVDSTTSEALAFSNAYIKELQIGANTDIRGYFLIPSVPANKNFTLVVSYIGYNTKTITIRVSKGKMSHYNIKLSSADIQMKTIESIGTRITGTSDSKISVDRISAKQLETAPKGVESDIFRTIKYLPGVQSTGDVSARYYVRGGASNQNLVLIDGITVYSPFHALGLFSVIDPDMINNIEFYKGGFGAQFGGRLSSIMQVTTKDGNKNIFSGKGSASFLTGKLLLEGPLPSGSFILTGRKSYSNKILNKFLNNGNIPADFYDFSFKANYSNPEFVPGGKFTFNGFFSGDNINNKDPRIEDYKWSNKILGFKWFQVGDSPLFFELGVSASSFDGSVIPKLSDTPATTNKVDDIGVQMDFTYMFDNKDEIGVGFHIKHIRTTLFIENSSGISVDLGSQAANIVLYTKYKFLQWNILSLDAGLRMNLTTLSQNKKVSLIEPRLSFTLRILPQILFKGAIGIFRQELITVSDENEVINIFEPWIISPSYLTPSHATHYILGVDLEPSSNVTFSVEGYYKSVLDLPLLNENKILPSDNDFLSGKGESYGIELSTKISPDPFYFTASYTYAHAYKEVDGLRYYPRYDIRHTVNLSLDLNIGKGWSASTVWSYNSGLPFTQLQGYYDKYYFNNIFSQWDRFDPRNPYSILLIQNLGRLPDYHRLDFTISKKFKIEPFSFHMDISVINVYNRHNIFYFKRDTGERVDMLPFLPTATISVEL
ncbi:MAG: TonB-dependent receptor [Melioribacteraceae bacterium]